MVLIAIAMEGVVVVVVETTRQQGGSPHFYSFHKQGGWTAAGLGILEEVKVVVCISVVVVVLISTVEFPRSSLASPLLLLMLGFLHHGHPQSAPGEMNLYM